MAYLLKHSHHILSTFRDILKTKSYLPVTTAENKQAKKIEYISSAQVWRTTFRGLPHRQTLEGKTQTQNTNAPQTGMVFYKDTARDELFPLAEPQLLRDITRLRIVTKSILYACGEEQEITKIKKLYTTVDTERFICLEPGDISASGHGSFASRRVRRAGKCCRNGKSDPGVPNCVRSHRNALRAFPTGKTGVL